MQPIERLIFHIGVPKTGSSLIQKALRALQPKLRQRGVAYIGRQSFLKIPSYTAWAPYARANPPIEEFLAAFKSLVDRERQRVRGGGPTVIISNEAGSGRARDFGVPFWPGALPAVTQLTETLRPDETSIIVYVRRQDRLLESLYMERIHRGRSLEWTEFRDAICQDDRVRYTELIAAVGTAPTVTEVRVRPFETIGAGAQAFVKDFLAGVDSADLAGSLPRKALEQVNVSYTEPAWRAALALNPILESEEQIDKTRRYLRDLFPPDRYPKVSLFSEVERAQLLERYREENEALFTRYLPEFDAACYSTVDGIEAFG
jgi:hypothetical protein